MRRLEKSLPFDATIPRAEISHIACDNGTNRVDFYGNGLLCLIVHLKSKRTHLLAVGTDGQTMLWLALEINAALHTPPHSPPSTSARSWLSLARCDSCLPPHRPITPHLPSVEARCTEPSKDSGLSPPASSQIHPHVNQS